MKHPVATIPAGRIMFGIALLLGVAGLLTLGLFARQMLFAGSPGGHRTLFAVGGTLLLLIGLMGPVRVIRNGALIPLEIRKTILVLGAMDDRLLEAYNSWPIRLYIVWKKSRLPPYWGSDTLNSMASSCAGDLPMDSRNGCQRGSSWILANSSWVGISVRPGSLYSIALASHSKARSA